MTLEKILKTAGKVAVGIGIAGALYLGNFHNKTGFWPFDTEVNGNSYGITTSAYVKINPKAKVYGIVLGGKVCNDGEINGISAALYANDCSSTTCKATTNGLQAALVYNLSDKVNGVQIGIANRARDIKGMQIGALLNVADYLNGIQTGLGNITPNSKRLSVGINASFGESYSVEQSTGAK